MKLWDFSLTRFQFFSASQVKEKSNLPLLSSISFIYLHFWKAAGSFCFVLCGLQKTPTPTPDHSPAPKALPHTFFSF